MRIFVTLVLALIVSWLAGSTVGVLLAEWAKGDGSFILVFMSVPLVSIIAAVVFLVAGTRVSPAKAINRAGLAMAALCFVLLAGFSGVELFVNGTLASAWRGVQLMICMAGAWLSVLIAQWAIFRWRSRQAPSAMLFGRGPGAPA